MSNFNYSSKFLPLALFYLFFLASCKDKGDPGPVDPPNGIPLYTVGIATNAGTKVEVFTTDTIETGYNTFFVRLTDTASNTYLSKATLNFTPTMTIVASVQGCPVEQPDSVAASDNTFSGQIMFSVVSTTSHLWNLKIDFHNPKNGKDGTVNFPVVVIYDDDDINVIKTSEGDSLYVAMKCMCGSKVGINSIEYIVNKKLTHTSFQTVDDLTFEMSPTPSGTTQVSSNNVNPSHTSKGHYVGKVNFTKKGEWSVGITLKRNGTTIGQTPFIINVE